MNGDEQQARSQVESIVEMVEALRNAETDDEREAAQTKIYDDPLEVQVRGGWHALGAGNCDDATQFRILLATGGPAVRIIGELNEYQEPETADVQYQNWFTPWATLDELTDVESGAVLDYCRQFYFAQA